MDGKSWNDRNDVANGREALNEREEVTNRGYEFLTLLMLSSDILWDLLHFFYMECIDGTPQQFLLSLLTWFVCYSLRSTLLSNINILPSLMLRSKICASFFQASTIIDATP